MYPHGSMPGNPSGSYDAVHPGHGRNVELLVKHQRFTAYGGSTSAEITRYLPGIPTLPPGSTLPQPSGHSSHASTALPSAATVFSSESGLQPASRSHFGPMTMPEHHGLSAWSHSSAMDDKSSYLERREQGTHVQGNPSSLEHYQSLPNPGRFPPNNVPHWELPSSLSHSGQYSRPQSIVSSYDHTSTQPRYDSRSDSSIAEASRSRAAIPPTILPPIEPGPYRNGMQLGPGPSAPFQPDKASEQQRAVHPHPHPHQIPSRPNRTTGDQQHDSPSQRPGPQI